MLLYLLFEHKSYADPITAFQLLRYMVRIWEQYRRENKKSSSLPPIYPLVIYHGRTPWQHPLDFHSLLTVKDPVLLPHIPNFSLVLHDLTRLDDQDIRGEVPVRIVLLVLKYVFREDLQKRLPEILSLDNEILFNKGNVDLLHTLLYYLIRGTGRLDEEAAESIIEESFPGGNIMECFLDKYIEQGVERGLKLGVTQGIEQGELRILSRQLRQRFGNLPAYVETKLQAASTELLEIWSDRVLTASSLDEIFEE